MTREDRAREAEEYRQATTMDVYRYYSRSIKILNGENALEEIDAFVNNVCLNGYRLHTIQFTDHAHVYCVFERLETVRV